MSNISQQPVANPLSLADQFLVWSGGSGDTRRASITSLLALLSANVTVTLSAAQQAMLPTFLPFVGGGNAIIASAAVGITVPAYNLGQGFRFVPVLSNTGATTINIATLGVKNLFMNGAVCQGGELIAGVPVDIVYDGVQFQIVGDGAAVTQQGIAQVVRHKTNFTTNTGGYFSGYGVGREGDANTEFMFMGQSASVSVLDSTKNGTGVARPWSFRIGGTVAAALSANDFSVSGSLVGGAKSVTVANTDNTNLSSNAVASLIAGGGAGGDPFTLFTIVGGATWAAGVDNSDSDKFKISASGSLGTSDVISITTNGLTTITGTGAGSTVLNLAETSGTPNGISCSFTTADPNNTSAYFMQNIGLVTERTTIRSNGGLANFSANNVNLSDVRVKDVFETYTPEMLDDLETRFLAIQRGRFKYNDQTHDDWNYGITAQSVKAVIPELAGVWNEKRAVTRMEEKEVTRVAGFVDVETGEISQKEQLIRVSEPVTVHEDVPEADQLLCVYDHDITQIAEALLARLLVRVRKLEEKA